MSHTPSPASAMREDDPRLQRLLTFLSFPSISTDPAHAPDMKAASEWLANELKGMGLETQIHPTPGHPVVLARTPHQENVRTVMLYGHYDVQPVDPLHLWETPPFTPTIRNGVIFARGATDNKGQLMAHVEGLRQYLQEHGKTPVNLILLFEGEEEIGSPNLASFLEEHRDELQCDIIAISDTGMVAPGVGTLTYGLRGIACMEVRVKGPKVDLHSGIFGGGVMNPNTAAARLVASLHNDEGRVMIDGFYDGVPELEPWEREAWSQLPIPSDETLEITGVPSLFGEAGYTDLERRWARPTAEINGIGGGYQGPGSKTVIPAEAFFKISFRLVPGQDPKTIFKKASAHLQRHCPPGVELEIEEGHDGEAYFLDPRGPDGQSAVRALEKAFGKPVSLIREGGSIPIVKTFQTILGVDTLLLGLALPDCRAHSPNENFPIASFEAGIRLHQALLQELAQ